MADDGQLPELTDVEREVYSWQMTVAGFGEEGQQRLKAATVMVSRVICHE
jgi:molybdopterin/thiamine biosynthesis adenylyltransferase